MTVPRATALLLIFAAIALIVVFLRAEQVRAAARVQEFRAECIQLRQSAWEVQTEVARLKAPDRIREHVERWRLNVLAPGTGPGWNGESGLAEAETQTRPSAPPGSENGRPGPGGQIDAETDSYPFRGN